MNKILFIIVIIALQSCSWNHYISSTIKEFRSQHRGDVYVKTKKDTLVGKENLQIQRWTDSKNNLYYEGFYKKFSVNRNWISISSKLFYPNGEIYSQTENVVNQKLEKRLYDKTITTYYDKKGQPLMDVISINSDSSTIMYKQYYKRDWSLSSKKHIIPFEVALE